MALSVVRYFAKRLFDRLRNLHAPRQESQEKEDCCICQGPFQDPRSLPCLHIYCSSCLDDYATKRPLTLVEFITERVLGIITIPCPLCRLQTHKAAGTILSFPEPKTCCHCSRFIKKVVRFAGCGHVNDNQCLPCMESFEETTGEVRCPYCIGTTCPIDILPQQYLCSNCEQFSSDDTCNECTGRLLYPDRSQQEIRNERKTECIVIVTCVIILVVLGLLYAFFSVAIYRQGQPVYGQQCYRDVVWYVDQHGIADNKFCKKVITGYRSWSGESSNKNSKRNSAKKKTEREENVERESKETSHEVKLEPVYENECVPKRVWEVTPEGEVHTKGCKQVLLGHRKVQSVTNDGNT